MTKPAGHLAALSASIGRMRTQAAGLARIPAYPQVCLATLLLGIASSFTIPYLSLFCVEHAGMTPLRLGLFMTLTALSGVAVSALVGRWSDCNGRYREALIAAAIAPVAGFCALGFIHDYAMLLVVGVAFLGASGAAMGLTFAYTRARICFRSSAEFSLAISLQRALLSVAWVFGPAVGALVLAASDFTGLFMMAAASYAAAALIIWTVRGSPAVGAPGPPVSECAGDRHAEALAQAAQPMPAADLDRAALGRAVLALAILGLLSTTMMIVLPLYITHGLQGSRLNVSEMLSLGALLEIPMMLALGARAGRLAKLRWLAAAGASYVAYFAALATVPAVEALIPMQALAAFAVSVISCLGMVYVQDMMPAAPASATALFFNAGRIGQILAGVLSGAMVEAAGFRGTFLGCAALACVVFGLFLYRGGLR